MTKQISIFWIDDEANREEDAEHLEQLLAEETEKDRTSPKVIFFITEEWQSYVEQNRVQRNCVDLFLVDYLLFIKRLHPGGGMSVAGEIRETFPNIPIYMFSAKPIPEIAKEIADSILTLKELQRSPRATYYDAIDYQKLRMSSGRSMTSLLNLLKAPRIDREKIVFALPESLKKTLLATTKVHFDSIVFAKWVRFEFLKVPGFVYNSIYSATKLGMKEETFFELSAEFETAKYSGVFSRTNPTLWWASMLRDIVFRLAAEKMPGDGTTDLSRLAPTLFGLDESRTSTCSVCGKRYPETVGYDPDSKKMKPVHYRCSIPHPEKTRTVYFEEERQLLDEG